jgi:DNA-binding PadR family transcriptional regulator
VELNNRIKSTNENYKHLDGEDIYEILLNNLHTDGKFILVLLSGNEDMHKAELKNVANEEYAKMGDEVLFPTRFSLDICTARLEGAGLVNVKTAGRVKLYSLSRLGEELLQYSKSKKMKRSDEE